jgi:hypothetical protein
LWFVVLRPLQVTMNNAGGQWPRASVQTRLRIAE